MELRNRYVKQNNEYAEQNKGYVEQNKGYMEHFPEPMRWHLSGVAVA